MQEDKLPDWAVGNAGEGMNVVMVGRCYHLNHTRNRNDHVGTWVCRRTGRRPRAVVGAEHSGIIGADAIITVRP